MHSLVNICKKTNTISYSCTNCLVSENAHVKHIYVYPTKDKIDYDPFYSCPIKEKAKSIPAIQNSLFCTNCSLARKSCKTVGLIWMCYKCKKNQLKMFTKPITYIDIDNNNNAFNNF